MNGAGNGLRQETDEFGDPAPSTSTNKEYGNGATFSEGLDLSIEGQADRDEGERRRR